MAESVAWGETQRDAVVAAWVASALIELDAADFAQVDIDYLFDPAPRLAARATLDCLRVAVQLGRESLPDLDGMAVIPVDDSESEMAIEAPSWDHILDQDWQYGPGLTVPGLYLVNPAIWRRQAAVEEYRRPVAVEELMGPGYAGYYRCWRTSEDAERGWEYSRDFLIRTTEPTSRA
jgi:hypothetical protein